MLKSLFFTKKNNSTRNDNNFAIPSSTSRECKARSDSFNASALSEESHNFLYSLFLFDFDAKRKSGTEKEKHERPNGTSHQGLCPRTPVPNYEILRLKLQYDENRINKEKENKNDLLPKKRFAFTLAEVLITLGIIGVVAAMTIPTLINTYQKEVTVQRLKQMYSIINQAAKMYTNDTETEFGSFDTQLTPKEFFEKYFSSYLKIVQSCEPASECYKNETPIAVDRKTQIDLPPYMVSLINGIFVGYFSNIGGAIFYVDINGASKPNRAGRDIFYFYLFNPDTIGEKTEGCAYTLSLLKQSINSGLYPGGYGSCYVPFTSYKRDELLSHNPRIDRNCSIISLHVEGRSGDACAAVIMLDGWKINKDYPW